ncbi:hypothetical protein HY030_00920 [Candidatus Gottesmanbacteria bacterium]|nr:hypothetical protein [Candidatus Gottesmanbacteria bacterium]
MRMRSEIEPRNGKTLPLKDIAIWLGETAVVGAALIVAKQLGLAEPYLSLSLSH